MPDTRQRKTQINQETTNQNPKDQETVNHGNSNSAKTKKSTQMSIPQRCFQKKYLILAILAITVIIYLDVAKGVQRFSSRTVDNLAVSLNLHTTIYAVVIDAGSTASRVNAFTFHPSVVNSQFILDHSFFHETKPGLTFYSKNPRKAAESLNVLLDKAKSQIPETQWASTPLILRATAGLRLLPSNEAQSILDECKRALSSSGFKVSNDSVAIMDGTDEGIYSWFTTNYILKKFANSDSDDDFVANTVAALDLGGGSTQITFATSKNLPSAEKSIFHVNAFDRNISVFTNSFLGLGLMAARKEILIHPDNRINQVDDDSENSTIIRAKCVNPIVTRAAWNYGGKEYLVKGPLDGAYEIIKTKNPATGTQERRPVVRFAACHEIIKKVVDAAVPRDLPGLREREVYAFSYYFERAAEAGLIDPFKGGVVTVEAIYKSASGICAYPNVDQPFMCLDLSFIYVLLHDGFGLDDKSKVYMHKYIDGHQLNWALGAAFSILQTES